MTPLASLSRDLRSKYRGLTAISVAQFSPSPMRLRFIARSVADTVLSVDESVAVPAHPAMSEMLHSGEPRIVTDLFRELGISNGADDRVASAVRFTYAVPVGGAGGVRGFVLFDAMTPTFFTPITVRQLRTYAELIGLAALPRGHAVDALRTAVRAAMGLNPVEDEETTRRWDRVAEYATLIATGLATKLALGEEFLEAIHQFAWFHDIGEVAIPDDVLLKPGRLTDVELDIARSHVTWGVELVDQVVERFGLGAIPGLEILRNIIAFHHEDLDGSGYPNGLVGDAIPLEARIVHAADVFDALTSERPYQEAWTAQQALAYLVESPSRFDPTCVDVLRSNPAGVAVIRRGETQPGREA